VRLTHRGVARLRLVCPADAADGCTGKLRLRRRIGGTPRTVGSRRFSVGAGRRGVVRVTVARVLRDRLTAEGLRIRVVARPVDAASAGRSAGRLIRILPPRGA
jgi:hypothetical protein